MKYAVLIAVVFFTAIQPARADKFYDGLVAYNAGDYAATERIWRPLAEQENGKAQSGLGLLYYRGLSVGQDYAQAREWFWKAAGHGVVQAQMFLSMIYYYGNGIPPNGGNSTIRISGSTRPMTRACRSAKNRFNRRSGYG